MDRFAAWLRREGNRQIPTSLIVLGMVCMIPAISLVPVTMTFGMMEDPQAATLKLIAICAISMAGWIPLGLHMRKSRNEVRIAAKGFAGSVKHWERKLGAHAQQLEEAAIDLEQIEAFATQTSLDADQIKRLSKAASARLWRMFELTVAAPARYGLTREQAVERIAEDGQWIADLRSLVERSTNTNPALDLDNSLAELRAIVDAREEAIEELRAR